MKSKKKKKLTYDQKIAFDALRVNVLCLLVAIATLIISILTYINYE